MTKIIGFAGRKQSGKTTCSEAILDFWNSTMPKELTAKIYNFADPLKKDICINIFGMSYDQCYGSDDDKNSLTDLEWGGKKLTAREVMQFIGTDLFRKMKDSIWADATIKKIKEESPSLAIIADCRFPNEVKAIKDAGGIVIKLNRNPCNSDHISETALDVENYHPSNFDTVITNDRMDIQMQNYAVAKFLNKKGIFPL